MIFDKIFFFSENSEIFEKNIFLDAKKKASELRKFLEYSFDVKSSNLSIYNVCSTFWALWTKLKGVVSPWYKKRTFFVYINLRGSLGGRGSQTFCAVEKPP